jgi:flagellar motor switch protein FliM
MSDVVAPEYDKQVRPYDFQRHEAMDKSRLRRLAPVLEVAAHRVTQALTSIVRTSARVEIGDLEQRRWEALANSLPEPTYVATATVVPIGGRVGLHVPLELAQAVVEMRLGGTVSKVVLNRALTEIELKLFQEAADVMVSEFFAALSVVIPISNGPLAPSASAVLVQMPNPSEICLLVHLKVNLDDGHEFEAALTLPLAVLLAMLDALERIDFTEIGIEPNSSVEEVWARLLEAPLDVSVSFPSVVLTTDEILSLAVGDIISLQRPEGLPLQMFVSGEQFCEVVPTNAGKRLACMVVESTPEEGK